MDLVGFRDLESIGLLNDPNGEGQRPESQEFATLGPLSPGSPKA